MNKKPQITNRHSAVYNALGVGRAAAVSLNCIAQRTGYSARDIRRMFEELTLNQMPICNFMDGAGYFLPASATDIAVTRAINAAYKNKFCRKDYALKQAQEHFPCKGI